MTLLHWLYAHTVTHATLTLQHTHKHTKYTLTLRKHTHAY
jgi:hypothetical protein